MLSVFIVSGQSLARLHSYISSVVFSRPRPVNRLQLASAPHKVSYVVQSSILFIARVDNISNYSPLLCNLQYHFFVDHTERYRLWTMFVTGFPNLVSCLTACISDLSKSSTLHNLQSNHHRYNLTVSVPVLQWIFWLPVFVLLPIVCNHVLTNKIWWLCQDCLRHFVQIVCRLSVIQQLSFKCDTWP